MGVPLATTGLVHPVWAMVAMAASVSAVLLNSFGGRLLPGRPSPAQAAETAARCQEVSRAETRADVPATELTPLGAPAHVVLDVPDIHCAGCEQSIERRLATRDGIDEVNASAGEHTVRVAYRPDRIGVHEIEEAVTSLGFRVQAVHATGHESQTASGS